MTQPLYFVASYSTSCYQLLTNFLNAMKRNLFFSAFLLGFLFTANAQDNCAGAVEVTAGTVEEPNTYTVGTINGTYEDGCWQFASNTPNAEWYAFTPSENGMARVTTAIAANPIGSTDTRFSLYTGTCGNLTCWGGNDDADIAVQDYRSDLMFPVAGGTTYYIVFDDNWVSTGFTFELSFEAQSCFVTDSFGFSPTSPMTTTTANIIWTEPLVGNFEQYIFEYGPQGFTPGTGTVLEVTYEEAALTDLEAGTLYDFYITTDCGGGDMSEAAGPVTFATLFDPFNAPYATSFEEERIDFMGWQTLTFTDITGTTWGIFPNDNQVSAHDGTSFLGAFGSGGVSDTWVFSTGVNLQADTPVTVSYWVMKAAFDENGNGGVNNLAITFGNGTTPASQYIPLGSIDDASFPDTFTQQIHTFTVPATGTYYMGFHYTAPAHTEQSNGGILIDSVEINSILGANEVMSSKFSIFPNPASSIINIANADGILMSGIQITDLNGRIVKSAIYNDVAEAQINIYDLASGIYMMTIVSDKGTMTKKVVKE